MGFLFNYKRSNIRILGKYSLFVLCFSGVSGVIAADRLHVLKKGETLYSLSRKYSTPLTLILERNNITDAGTIIAGQKIYIPTIHTVAKGETLYGIARKYTVSVRDLVKANKINAQHVLKTGKKLIIPVSAGKSLTAASQKNTHKPYTHDPRSYIHKKVDKSILWPVRAASISYLSGKLYGVVIDSYKNEPVCAITSGRVVSKGVHRGYGTVVFVQSKKYVYVYGGLKDASVKAGQNIVFGQKIGILSQDSLTARPRLYFMVYKNNKPLDPTKAPRGY